MRRLRFSSSTLFESPAYAISQPAPSVAIANVITCGSNIAYLLVDFVRAWGCAR